MSEGPKTKGLFGQAQQPPRPVQILRMAVGLHQQGQLSEAETLYRDVLKLHPGNSDALHFLGVLESQRGRRDAGLSLIDQAIVINPRNLSAHYNRAGILRDLERLEEALECYDRALALKDDHHAALNNRGTVLHDLKRYGEAVKSYDRAIAVKPDHADAYANRGNTLIELGRLEDALASFDRAIAVAPKHAAAHYGRGNALASLKRLDEAVTSYDRALALTPRDARVLNNRGVTLARIGRHEQALESFNRAIAFDPRHADAYRNRGDSLIQLKRPDEALASYDQALDLRPNHAESLYGRAHALTELKRGDEAILTYEQLLRVEPDYPYALGMLLHAKRTACDWRGAATINSDVARGVREGRRIITPLAFLAVSDSEEDNARCSRILIQDKFKAPSELLWRGERYRHDRIRVVYLSADFRSHAVASQIAGVFERHDRSRFEIMAMSYGPNDRSSMRARLERAFEKFFDINGTSDQQAAARIREVEADIVVDLTGLTGSSRPGILALRPAGLQVQHLGFAGTVGADYVDYVIADDVVIPEHNQRHYAEKVVALPDTFMPTDTGRQIGRTPTRAEAGLPDKGFVFCAFNNSYKFAPDMFDVWMGLLRAVPGSLLWLPAANDSVRRNLGRGAEAGGIASNRLVFAPYVELGVDHLGRLALADLFLDTLPYNAHSSACDALWAGVPVVTQLGETFAGRVGASVLQACGLSELIANSRTSYETIALHFARAPSAQAELRARLAANRKSCALFDTARFTRHLEAAYALMWENHRRGRDPAPFKVPRMPS